MPRFGPFEVTGELGRGGMGIVFRGFDPVIRREVALKTIRLHDIDDAGERFRMQERLEREAQSAGRLSHPNIVTIYQFGYEQVRPGEPVAYIAMEFVPGRTLASLLAEGRTLHTTAVIGLLRQAAAGLDYAHAQGVIHRDIKPANLLVTPEAHLKIADFGVAKISAHTLTMTGTILGSPFYMSPEQIRGDRVDPRTDQYALAVVAFEAFGGRKPFNAETLSSLVYKIVHEEPPDLILAESELARSITPVLRKALAKDPGLRYPNCSAFINELARALERFDTPAPTPPRQESAAARPPELSPRQPPTSAAPRQPASSGPAPVPILPDAVPAREIRLQSEPPGAKLAASTSRWGLAAAGIAVAAALGWIAFRPGGPAPKPQPDSVVTASQTTAALPPQTLAPQLTGVQPAALPAVKPDSVRGAPAAMRQPVSPPPAIQAPGVEPQHQTTVPAQTESAPQPQAAPAVESHAPPPEPPAPAVRTEPRLLSQVQPSYTAEARLAGIEGTVGLTVELNELGIPVRAGIVRSLNPGLDRKAIQAVAQWRFAPATADGKPVASVANVEVRFHLVGSPVRGRPSLLKQK